MNSLPACPAVPALPAFYEQLAATIFSDLTLRWFSPASSFIPVLPSIFAAFLGLTLVPLTVTLCPT